MLSKLFCHTNEVIVFVPVLPVLPFYALFKNKNKLFIFRNITVTDNCFLQRNSLSLCFGLAVFSVPILLTALHLN